MGIERRSSRARVWACAVACAVCAAPLGARAEPLPPAEASSAEPSNAQGVQAPELEHFVEARYPEQAQQRELEADVVLALDIDENGRVTSVQAVEPAGHGFDEAAETAARGFLFRPARRGDRPVRSRILYRYSFHFRREPREHAPSFAVLAGRVRIGGTPGSVAGARVRVKQGNASVAEQATARDGSFRFTGLHAGTCSIQVEAAGFEPYVTTESLNAGEELSLSIGLLAASDSRVTITVRGTRPTREVTRRTISRRELSLVPGTSGDALRALQNLPGVARPPALSGLLVVRGNADQTTPVFVDGLWIPNVYHFGGLSSVVPTEMLDEIHFYPGNFSVRYGRALAGVVDAHLRETRADGRYHGLAQLDLIDARLMLEGPVPLGRGWNFIGGVRRSHVDAWLAPLLSNRETSVTAAPVYYDYQLIFDKRPTPNSYLRVGILGFDDRFRLIARSAAGGGQLDTINATTGAGAIYELRPSPETRLEFTLSMARNHERFAISTTEFDLVAYGSVARGELEWRLWPGATLHTGYDSLLAPYSARGELPEIPGADSPDIGHSVAAPVSVFDEHALFFAPAVFAELDLHPSPRLQLVSGVRVDYTHATRRLDVSPRLVARYDLAHGFPRTTLKAGSGLFVQAPGLLELLLKDPSTELRSQRAFQNSLGLEQELSERVEASVEGFFNLLDDLVSRQTNAQGTLEYNNYGTGRIFGAEFMLRYKPDDRFFGWLSYTLSRSERSFVPGQPSHLFELDQTHILTALGSYDLGRGWEFGLRFRYVTGNLFTPCQGSLFSSSAASYVCVSGPINSQRLPAFHELDLRLDKRWTFSSFTLGAYLDLINAYNRKNPDLISYNYDYSESKPQTASLPIVPSIGVRGEF